MCIRADIALAQVMNDKGVMLPHPFLEMIEAVCIAWFTLEYIVRCRTMKRFII